MLEIPRLGASPLASLASLLATFTSHRTSCSTTFAPGQPPFHTACAPRLPPLRAFYAALLAPLFAGRRRGGRAGGWGRRLSLSI